MDLLTALGISVGVNILMFIPAYLFKTDKLTDISYAATFVLVSLYGLAVGGITGPKLVLFTLISLWALRLGSYLLIRIRKMGKDSRFDDMRDKFWSFAKFWLLQGVTVWAVLVPSILSLNNEIVHTPTYMYIGVAVWLFGLVVEAIADLQKYKFINNPTNKGRWIESGLWKYSRHPNYFGEILVWVGVYLFTLSSLVGWNALIGLVGPLYIAILIIFVSGIPLLEKSADKRWGDNPEYREYKKRTSQLIPLPHKIN